MESCQHLPYLLLLLPSLACFVMGQCQEPVNEGSSYTMNCSFPLSKARGNLHWSLSSGLQAAPLRLLTCDSYKHRCYRSGSPKLNATYNLTSTHLFSSLTIVNITSAHRDSELHCKVWEDSDNKFVIQKKCNLKVYHAPKTPTCQSKTLTQNETSWTCQTSKAYPGIFCKLFQETDGKFGQISIEMSYSNGSNSRDRKSTYHSASCSFILPEINHDLFKLKMFASIEGNAILGSEKTVSIKSSTMHLEKPAPQERQPDGEKRDNSDGDGQLLIIVLAGVIPLLLVLFSVIVFLCKRRRTSKSRGEKQDYQSGKNLNNECLTICDIPA